MSNIVKAETMELSPIEMAMKYLDGLGNNLTKNQREQFLQICQVQQLNPFTKEIYGIPFGDKFNIVVAYEVYLRRGELSGQLDGWRAWHEGSYELVSVKKNIKKKDGSTFEKIVKVPKGQMKGCIEITRKDWTKPFYHEVYLDEYSQENEQWGDKPITMIKKVAIAQGFRMAFPVEFKNMPPIGEEMTSVEREPVQVENIADRFTAPAPAPQITDAEVVTPDTATEAQRERIETELLRVSGESVTAMNALLAELSKGKMTLDNITTVTGKQAGYVIGKLKAMPDYVEPEATPEPTTELF